MSPPFNLTRIFSIASLLTTSLLTLALSVFLSENLEDQLLERDKRLMEDTMISEFEDEMEDLGIEFATAHLHEEFVEELTEFLEETKGAQQLEMVLPTGTILWSSAPEQIGTQRTDPQFSQARAGESSIVFQEVSMSETLGYFSALTVPIQLQDEVVGVMTLQRQVEELHQQVHSVKQTVYVFCILFGGILYLVMLLIVIPASRKLQKQHQQLLEAKEKLIANERLSAVGEVCGAVAHGLKNPIASVRAAVQLLAMRNIDEERRSQITTDILQEVDRLSKRLQDLLDFIRPFSPEFQYVNLHDLLNNAVRSLSWKADEEGIRFQIQSVPDTASAYVDGALVEEAVLIVLSNAMEASKSGDTIRCEILQDREHQGIVVRDHGKGIAMDILPKVFEQFFTTRSKGVGLGLALCQKIMKLHQGEIQIESKVNEGTLVKLLFPQQIPKRPT